MKLRWLPTAVCCASLGMATFHTPNLCRAQETKPKAAPVDVADESEDSSVVVVAMGSLDTLIPNIQHIARMVGQGAVAGGISSSVNQFAGGLDRARPFGVFVDLDENGQPTPIGCLPIEDMEQFLGGLSIFGEANDLGDGLYEFNFGSPVYAQKAGKWLYVAQTEEALGDIDENMGDALPKMIQKYDVRIQVNPQNVPDEFIDFIMGQMQAGLDQTMAAQSSSMDAEETEAARATSEQMMEQMQEGIEGTEKLVIGLAVNKAEKQTLLDFGTQFVVDSKYAKSMEKMKASKTAVGGIPQDASMMTLQTFQMVAPEEIAQFEKTLDASLKSAFKSIDENSKDEASATKAKELVNKLIDILVDSAKQGKLESALDVSADSTLSIVGSVSVADGAKVEALAAEIAAEAAKEKGPFQLKLNTGKHAGFNLHKATVALPPDAAAEAKKVFGSSVTIAIGTSPKVVTLAVGQNCDASLKSAIDRAAIKPSMPAELVKMRLVFSKVLNFVQSIKATPISEAMLDAASAGSDRILIDSKTSDRGMVVRLSLEDGVVKAIAAGVKAGQSGGF